MGYKITKYKGKTKIKDTKTGKSAEIDIEKFMNGGYSDVSKYMEGVDFDCPEGDVACQERKRLAELSRIQRDNTRVGALGPRVNDLKSNVPNQSILNLEVNNPNILEEENKPNFQVGNISPLSDYLDNLNSSGFGSLDPTARTGTLQNPVSPKLVSETIETEQDIEEARSENKEKDFNIFNPYAGADIPGAAFHLGQSIKNKNALGIAAGGLKVASGLARNITSGLGYQNRYNQVMEDYYKDQKNKKNPIQYNEEGGKLEKFAYGGKKDEELATGEFMHGVTNEDTEDYNAEIEEGEYFQTNEGDISEVVGNKHSSGGEKIQMEEDDRVLSDKLKLGGKQAKMLSEKYDLKLKAKNTYSDVLDKFRKKKKLDKIIEEEAEILKKLGEQSSVNDATTRDFNIEVLTKKREDILKRKHPIEEERKSVFEELFDIQESSKKGEDKPQENLEMGGMLSSLAQEYNIPIERARELVQEFSKGGKIVPKYEEGDGECPDGYEKNSEGNCVKKELDKEEAEALDKVPEGQSIDSKTNLFGGVTPDSFNASIQRNKWYFDQHPNFDVTDSEQVKDYQIEYNKVAERLGSPKVQVDGKWGEQTDSIDVRKSYREIPYETEPGNPSQQVDSVGRGLFLFPGESPLPPSALQGTIKSERRFDRVRPSEINVEPYLQDIKDREAAQVQSLEGLSPNVRAAVLSNVRANNQKAESDIRNQIDTQNIQSTERAIYTNAQIQQREENASEQDRLSYEQRQYRAQALTDNDLNNYFNQLQSINKQRFMDIHNLNLINATNEDVYFDGQNFRRKNTDREILQRVSDKV